MSFRPLSGRYTSKQDGESLKVLVTFRFPSPYESYSYTLVQTNDKVLYGALFPSPYGENYSYTLPSESRISTGSPGLFAAEKKKPCYFSIIFLLQPQNIFIIIFYLDQVDIVFILKFLE